MIIVTGATGKLGGAVVRHLRNLVPASQIGVCARHPIDLADLITTGIDIRQADFEDPISLTGAFAEADRLLLISSDGIDREARARQHRNAIDAAMKTKVGHAYYTSLTPGADSVAYVMQAHLDTEAYLKSSGLRHTILRNGVYAEAWPSYLGNLAHDEVAVPADGPVNWVARDDLGAGIAALLAEEASPPESLYLTGPACYDLAATTQRIARLLGRALAFRRVSVEEYVQRQVAAGKSEDFAWHWATTYAALARGEFKRVDSRLAELCGRPLRTFEQAVMSSLREKRIPSCSGS